MTVKSTLTLFLGTLALHGICSAAETYVRWGRSHCNGTGSSMVYKGYMAGVPYAQGSGANYLCLPEEPIWGSYDDTKNRWVGHLEGVELDIVSNVGPFSNFVDEKNPTCALCLTHDRSSTVMIPGRNICYPGWHLEYSGYLVSNAYQRKTSSQYVCMDGQVVGVPGHDSDQHPSVAYPVESICKGLPCPPYKDGRELTCVVCSK